MPGVGHPGVAGEQGHRDPQNYTGYGHFPRLPREWNDKTLLLKTPHTLFQGQISQAGAEWKASPCRLVFTVPQVAMQTDEGKNLTKDHS